MTPLSATPAPALAPPARTAPVAGQTGWVRLTGTEREPVLEVHIHPHVSYPGDRRLTMKEWVKATGNARWDPHTQAWLVTGVGSLTPTHTLAEAGLALEWDTRPAEFAHLTSLDQLAYPVAKLASNRRTVMVRHRLAGFDLCKQLIGVGAVWDKDRRLFRIDVADVLTRDGTGPAGDLRPRPGVVWPQDAIDEAYERHAYQPVDPAVASLAKRLSTALDVTGFDPSELAAIGVLPTDGRKPFPYQEAGSLAVAAGRTCLWDEPGVGKTAGSLLAARILGAKRTIVVVPPLLTTNWAKEIGYANLCPPDQVVTYRAGRKEKEPPAEGAVIISDSLLVSRPALKQKLIDWGADVLIYDEAHRGKTIGAARTEAVLDLGVSVKHAPFVLTGTPLFGSPHELVPLLELARVMAPVFGGRHQFLSTFCTQDFFGRWQARERMLGRLRELLSEHVWVRRRKRDVLPQLPVKRRQTLLLDVPLTEFKEAHREAISKVHAWLTWFHNEHGRPPGDTELDEWARSSSITLISQMRQAAGRAKVPAAIELARSHLEQTGYQVDEHGNRIYNRPMILWVHHKSVAAAMMDAIPDDLGTVAMIAGATPDAERDLIVDLFQAGRIAVLVASITKAGVGLTLTRGADAVFIEPSWVPSEIKQAEDRFHRPGQEADACIYTTLVARGTLDETIQHVLGRKTEVLEGALGDTDDSVVAATGDDARALSLIVAELLHAALRTWKPPQKTPDQGGARIAVV